MAVAAVTLLSCIGCYNNDAVKAFLRQPRTPVAGTEYRILPPDEVLVTSLHVAEIHNTRHIIRPDGKINLPLLGELDVAGRTPTEIEELLGEAASLYYDKVAATVQVMTYNSQRFYVFGQVERPGPLPWTGRDSLLDALSRALPNGYAWPERIIVVRGDDPKAGGMHRDESGDRGNYGLTGVRPELRDRPRKKMVVNMMAMLESGDMSNNILMMPEDVIYVQPNPLARLTFIMEALWGPIRPTAGILEDSHYIYDDWRYLTHQSVREAVGPSTPK